MFYDLNVDYNPSTSDADLSKTLAFLSECEHAQLCPTRLQCANVPQ
jgi:hypothetical protein